MGNVSARGEGSDNPSGIEFEEGEFQGQQMEEVGQSNAQFSYSAREGSSDLMGQSPPHSPRTTRSPVMFTPQVPMVPLQKPDEMQIPTHAWIQDTSEYDDMFGEQGIPTMITWSYGGKEVAVEGSWDNWKTKKPLQKSGKDFTIMNVLPSGVYQYRFLVDGQWRYAPDLPCCHDDMGSVYNILDLQMPSNLCHWRILYRIINEHHCDNTRNFKQAQLDYVPEDLESIAGFEPPQSPDSSYNNTQLSSEDYAKEPPLVPPHLQMTLLNGPTSCIDNNSSLSRPQHVVLNHLYMQKAKTGQSVLALGSTHRFLAKYVTVVLYKSLR